jgi:DNA-binding NarL/FixJ family response regulator
VGEASNGIQAEQKVRELQPDVVLLDVDLPLLNGIELARRLHISYPNIKLVFVTTETSEEMAQFALSTGASGYVLKSSIVADLIPALAAALSNKRFISKAVLK